MPGSNTLDQSARGEALVAFGTDNGHPNGKPSKVYGSVSLEDPEDFDFNRGSIGSSLTFDTRELPATAIGSLLCAYGTVVSEATNNTVAGKDTCHIATG